MKNIFTFILFIGITISTTAQNKNEKLYLAVVKNDLKKTEKLIKKGADVNFIKQSGPWMKVSLLITAINNKNLEITKILLESKADVNWKDGFKTSAILYGANSGNVELTKLLLKYGANINDSDGGKNTVLTAAKESKNLEMFKFVEEKINEKK
jgi:ankyrin repeat protein|tara:strand:+ start:4648 stop:5106 length:459 start_codon:yes stop_codon:yes gene_type:complete